MSHPNRDQCKAWMKLRSDFLDAVDEMDKATEWQEKEPYWWLEMIRVRDAILDPQESKS